MVSSLRAKAVMAAVVIAIAGLSVPCSAAKAAKNTNKIAVPGNLIKGSAVTSGRSFTRTKLPEDTLAGIRLGRKAQDILNRWGNPSRITVGSDQAPAEGGVPPTTPAYNPPAIGGIPTLPGLNLPGIPMPGASAPTPAQPTSTPMLSAEEVTWTYDLQGGITLEFVITDGTITQITAGGYGPWGLSKTRTGLQLGDTYKLVLYVCGYPEYQRYSSRFLRVSYINKNRALFTFLNNRLVGVTIAMVESDLLK